MDTSPDTSPQKTSPLIIKLCSLPSDKKLDSSSSEPVEEIQPLTSSAKPMNVKMQPVAFTLCRLSKDGVLTKSPEALKISPALSLKLGAALRQRITMKYLPSQNTTVGMKLDHSNESERQSLTSHASKLVDDKLDFVHGGDKSQSLQLSQPPLAMQPSNLLTDDLLDVKYGGGGSETTMVQESSTLSSSVVSTSSVASKKHFTVTETAMEPAKKKIKLTSTIPFGSEPLFNVKHKNISTTKSEMKASNVTEINIGEKTIEESLEMDSPIYISSAKKGEDLSIDLELNKIIENDQSTILKTDHTNFITCSSNKSDSDTKSKLAIVSLKDRSKAESKSDVTKTVIESIPKLLKKGGPSFPKSRDVLITANNKGIEVNKIYGCLAGENKSDQKVNVGPKIVCPFNRLKKDNSSKFKQSKVIAIDDEPIADKAPKIKEKKSVSFNQDVKICPFDLEIEDKPKTEYDKSLICENVAILVESVKDDISYNANNECDMKSKMSVINPKEFLTELSNEMDNSKSFLDEACNSKSQSESVVNCSQNEDNETNLKQNEREQDEDFSGDDGNELIGISSDESNQMESQNGTQEPEIEFDILDEFESNDNDPEPEVRSSESESEISADEIDAMLEEGLGDYGKPNAQNQHEVKEKIILKARGKDHFEVLPEGWIEVTHNSGMPIYLHKLSRVCCVSKPYFLGPGSTRKHEIPISAIPCLQYLKELEKEKLEEENILNGVAGDLENGQSLTNKESIQVTGNDKSCTVTQTDDNTQVKSAVAEKSSTGQNASNSLKGSNLILPSAKLESVKEVKVSGSLDYLTVREYCQKRFEFQTITVKRFRTWIGRRKHQKQLRRKQRPFLPDNTQLITCPLPLNAIKASTGNTLKREFIMNPTGKSPVCILHEYVQHTLRAQPRYVFKELESASTPYGAVVIINDMEYGTGYGSSKKVAKSEAAKSALEILIPKIKKIDSEKRRVDDDDCQDVEFFDQIRIEDPRISDLCVKAGQPFPYQILLECLKRNYGMGDTEVSIKMKSLKHQKSEFTMKVGKHKKTVLCKNKRDGKHQASQAILQELHPHINSWGSLLRMYGKGSCKTLKEKKEEEQQITELQSKACVNKPNLSILNKLKEEMMKYREKMMSKKPIGKLIPERMNLFSISDSNLKSIEL